MANAAKHKWAFRAGMRAGLYSWRSSSKAIERLKSATSEIKSVRKTNPVAAGEGVVILAERIWPAFEHIDSSSGALGTAVRRTLEALIPVLIEAPADQKTRAKWLERLREAIVDDGVQYLQPISDEFGRIAAFPALMNEHADRDMELIRGAWVDRTRFSFVSSSTLTLSCLLEVGRYEDLHTLLSVRDKRFWHDDRFETEALPRQGKDEEALALASRFLEDDRRSWSTAEISQFCESILIRQGRKDEAYQQFGLPTAAGGTYLAMWRDLVKRYPDRNPRAVLEDLIAHHGRKGKWFAAAKTAGFLDLALECASDFEAEPLTLIRAARDFREKEPAFASHVALNAVQHMLVGRGYEISLTDLDNAVDYLVSAATHIDRCSWAMQELARLGATPGVDTRMAQRVTTWVSAGA